MRKRQTSRTRRHRLERKHAVKAELRVHELSKAGTSLRLDIYSHNMKIGQLVVGRGSLYWYGKKRHKSKRIPWSEFSRKMDELAYGSTNLQ